MIETLQLYASQEGRSNHTDRNALRKNHWSEHETQLSFKTVCSSIISIGRNVIRFGFEASVDMDYSECQGNVFLAGNGKLDQKMSFKAKK